MQKIKKKSFAYTDILTNYQGFTLLSVLFSLSILFIMLPLLPTIIAALEQPTYDEEFSVRQFFHFIQDELYASSAYSISENDLILVNANGETTTINLYQQVVRRQVESKGYEVLVRQIKDMQIQFLPKGLYVEIETIKGEIYEKKISFL